VADTSSPAGSTHVLADLWRVDPALLSDGERIETMMRAAAAAAGARVLSAHFHRFGGGGGVTGVLLLAESHLSVHTWPEVGLAAVDAFMCGRARAEAAIDALCAAMRAERRTTEVIRRGGQ